jgi:effector-binding domain-containing protein
MPYHVELKTVAAQMIAAIRIRSAIEHLSRDIPPACGEVWEFVKANRIAGAGKLVAVYWDTEMNLEVGVEAGQTFAGSDRVICSSLPAGPVATTVHWGAYSGLGAAHDAVQKWCKDHGHEPIRPCWELYGHWSDDPSQLRTDVFYLLASNA